MIKITNIYRIKINVIDVHTGIKYDMICISVRAYNYMDEERARIIALDEARQVWENSEIQRLSILYKIDCQNLKELAKDGLLNLSEKVIFEISETNI